MNTGIDAISFYTSNYYLDLKTLGETRGVDPDKFYIGLGQEKMAIPPPDEDIVTMAANAPSPGRGTGHLKPGNRSLRHRVGRRPIQGRRHLRPRIA